MPVLAIKVTNTGMNVYPPKKEEKGHCHDAASKISLKMFQVKIQKIK